ncbi:DUF2231 domain-containing protein [Pseudomonas petrae]|uniref:DUF2231 domain-containing protein n=1 Tax=Pseudomonas petrae TaxID=2912190 RepID=A0ABS9I5J6_9PSED|nr:hypothetical protein [Pseudomonas petrae]MCF7539690.1 hypothetical protein [Pseudomonas petrae]MCF7543058.1 hypothetical protein [Pseudomonas petrae]MCF7557977.1 hypothetical protein [Pseudomonas petrae]
MNTTTHLVYRSPPGPLHAIMLGGTVPLFLGALLSDITYFQTYQIQWSNFASWLIAGGLVFCGLAVLFALVNLIRADRKAGRPVIYLVLLVVTWALGLVNAFEHAKDAFATMPSGLILSALTTLLIGVTAWLGLTSIRSGEGQ